MCLQAALMYGRKGRPVGRELQAAGLCKGSERVSLVGDSHEASSSVHVCQQMSDGVADVEQLCGFGRFDGE